MRNLPIKRRKWLRVRIAIMSTLLLVFAGFVIRRAFDLGVVRSATLKEMAEEQYLRDIHLSPKRGTIYDRHGAELAVSVEVDSVWANPREIRAAGAQPALVAAQLATVLPIDVARITRRLSSELCRDNGECGPPYFVWIERHITPQQAARVRALDLPGVSMSREARRYYPNRELASHVLGFANIDGEGIEGLELAFEDHLKGSVQAVPAIRDRRGRVVFSEQLLDDRAAQGEDLYLTIDKTIQHLAERELELAVRTFEARAGSVVVMDPATGEVLALASYPTYNPNEPGHAAMANRRNRAITDRFEPGSTVKPFTIAGALTAGTVRSDQIIDCEMGAMQVAEYTIHDSHPMGELTPAQILAYSSNIGTAKIGATLGRAGLFRTFRRFGFGESTGLPLPGETGGILRHHRRWYEMDAATISFGQGVSVTNVQMATAMSVIANGGLLMRPILVKRIADARGDTVEETEPRSRRRVIPRDTARLVADMLTAVTGPNGTGVEAAIDGYLVAGKTGTAQKADYVRGGYAEDRWMASFVGFVPAEQPRLVISVVIDEPIIAHYGGIVAGPVFRRVGEAALRHLGVPAATGGEALAEHRRAHDERERDARDAARAEREAARAAGEPDPARVRAREEAERQATAEAALAVPSEGSVRVPDLVGHSARAALVELSSAGLTLDLVGSGLVVSQSPRPDEIVRLGTSVHVELAPPQLDPPVVQDADADRAADADVRSVPRARVAALGPEGAP